MRFRKAGFVLVAAGSIVAAAAIGLADYLPGPPYDRAKVVKSLLANLDGTQFRLGAPIYIRIFKLSRKLELWQQQADGRYALIKAYPICHYSGELGPKLKEGDRQSPEGFYRVTKSALNPNSRYHLSFNLGFPNAYDRAHNRTGSYLMVHGNCVSLGCYAMTNSGIEEIYTLVSAALIKGHQHVDVHIFPFEMTKGNLELYRKSKWAPFWQTLKPAYDQFEKTRKVPKVRVVNKRYVISMAQ